MKKNWIYFVIILIIISLDPKMVYWSSQGNFSNAILKLISFQPTNKCISSFHLHILISTIHMSNSKERTLEDDKIKNSIWLLQKTYMSIIVPHFTSLSWEGNLSFTASQDISLLGKAALDHTGFYHLMRHTCFLFNSTLNCNSSFIASQRQSIKECLEVVALDHTTFHHLAISILFLISLQVEIHVTFPYLDEIRYIELYNYLS